MPVLVDFSLSRPESATLTVSMTPAVPIGGWSIQFQALKRFGGISGLITKSVSSGFNGLSGITVTNSGQGVFNISLYSSDTSGLSYGNYAYSNMRLDSGFITVLTEGYLQLIP